MRLEECYEGDFRRVSGQAHCFAHASDAIDVVPTEKQELWVDTLVFGEHFDKLLDAN